MHNIVSDNDLVFHNSRNTDYSTLSDSSVIGMINLLKSDLFQLIKKWEPFLHYNILNVDSINSLVPKDVKLL